MRLPLGHKLLASSALAPGLRWALFQHPRQSRESCEVYRKYRSRIVAVVTAGHGAQESIAHAARGARALHVHLVTRARFVNRVKRKRHDSEMNMCLTDGSDVSKPYTTDQGRWGLIAPHFGRDEARRRAWRTTPRHHQARFCWRFPFSCKLLIGLIDASRNQIQVHQQAFHTHRLFPDLKFECCLCVLRQECFAHS